MNEKFVEKIYKTIVEDGVGEYKNLLDNTALKNATDKYWINALELYEKLTSEEKEKMLKFAELIMIDTISSVFRHTSYDGMSAHARQMRPSDNPAFLHPES